MERHEGWGFDEKAEAAYLSRKTWLGVSPHHVALQRKRQKSDEGFLIVSRLSPELLCVGL